MQQVLNQPKILLHPPTTQEDGQQVSQQHAPAKEELHIIPTPDAQGIVTNYEELYTDRSHKMSFTVLRFSETVEECQRNGLLAGIRQYVMDERDAVWLEQWNREARGEGTSSSGTEASTEDKPVMSEDQFELVMGFFEKFASDHLPLLHAVCPLILSLQLSDSTI